MINRMSKSHTVANRAYIFLQQLLSHMDKSLWLVGNSSPARAGEDSEDSIMSSQTYMRPYSDMATTTSWAQPEPEAQYNLDFLTLLDVTQDLAENLGTQLETHEGAGSTLWSWIEE